MRENAFGFLLGLSAGVALGILFAPRSGHDLRDLIKSKARDGADAVKSQAGGLWDSASHAYERGRSDLMRKSEGVKAAVEAGTRAYQQTVT